MQALLSSQLPEPAGAPTFQAVVATGEIVEPDNPALQLATYSAGVWYRISLGQSVARPGPPPTQPDRPKSGGRARPAARSGFSLGMYQRAAASLCSGQG
jgi:hypothetical protein